MKIDDAGDLALRSLHALRVLEPDAVRIERIRTRCHERIARRQKKVERSAESGRFRVLVLEAAVLGGLSFVYLCGIVYDLLRLHAVR